MFMNLLPKESAGSIFRFVCLIGCLSPSVAHAGFDWTPPPAAPTHQAAPVAQDAAPAGPLTPEPDALPVPVGNVESAPVSHNEPLVINNKPTPAPVAAPIPTPAPVAEKIDEQPTPAVAEDLPAPTPVPAPAPAPAPIAKAKPTPAPIPVATAAPAAVVEGFGKDIPLVIALRDIVPAKYAYAFSPKEVAGTKISWRGGKVWQDVLKDALAPHGLNLSVTDTQIIIFANENKSSDAAPAAPAPTQTAKAVAPTPAPDAAQTMFATRPASVDADPIPLAAPKDAQGVEAQEKMAAASAAPETHPVMTAMDMKSTRKWQARPGTTLRQTLEAWTKESNVELNWSTPYDYPINNAFYFDGQFTQAVDSLLSSYGGENPSPKGRLYPNLPEGPSVLMVN
jgi:hypothetical protein